MATIPRQIMDIPAEKVPGIEAHFGQMMQLDMENIPPKYRKAFDGTREIAAGQFTMRAVFASFDLDGIDGDVLKLKNGAEVRSQVMADVFRGSEELVFYVATLYGYDEADAAEPSMFNKLFLDNWGTAYIECADTWLTKTIARDMEEQELYATHSFGPGQTDIPLEAQAPIFQLLRPEEIGVTLNDRFMMHPKKSVSGILGLKREKDEHRLRPCDICARRDTCPSMREGD